MKHYQRKPYISVVSTHTTAPPPWYQVQFNDQDRERKRHDETIAAIRAQLEAAASGGCTAETALLAIAVIIREEKHHERPNDE